MEIDRDSVLDLSRFTLAKLEADIVDPPDEGEHAICVAMIVRNTDHGAPVGDMEAEEFTRIETVYPLDELTVHEVRRRLIDALTHELDECFFIDGEAATPMGHEDQELVP